MTEREDLDRLLQSWATERDFWRWLRRSRVAAIVTYPIYRWRLRGWCETLQEAVHELFMPAEFFGSQDPLVRRTYYERIQAAFGEALDLTTRKG